MERALPKRFAKVLKCDWLIEMLLDVTADLFRQVSLRISADRPRAATQASAKASFLRVFGMRIERHILAPRAPGRTRWPAIDASTGDSEDKFTVAGTVARHHRLPARVFVVAIVIIFVGRVGASGWHMAWKLLCEYRIRDSRWESVVG
jgi:hypothetical protein